MPWGRTENGSPLAHSLMPHSPRMKGYHMRQFRNARPLVQAAALWCGALAASVLIMLGPAGAADDDGFKPIFNGQNLDGWDGNPKFWSVKEGAIVGQTTKENPTAGNTFCIWRQGTLDDFVLRASFKIDGGNSGIQYRSRELEQWRVG